VGVAAAAGFHALLFTKASVQLFAVRDPDLPARWASYLQSASGRRIAYSDFGFRVAALRRELVEDPLHRDVTRAAQRELDGLAAYLSDVVLESLVAQAEAGRTNLVVWPHESMYYLPWHLIPLAGGTIGDRFTVTVVPSLESLFTPPGLQPESQAVLAVASATGGVLAGLHEEPSLHDQAEQISALFRASPLIGDAATPAAVLAELGSHRYVHIAAHGAQDADAPLFARLYLAGGCLYAHDILEQDLRGVELVTLSACESALLRYDFLDNIHGLTAAFLRAGVRAVIGALWPVEPDVAHTFFTELYAVVGQGSDVTLAYRHAQTKTRQLHPVYRDWGAFVCFGVQHAAI
jgi:CHAT domain-containing protein